MASRTHHLAACATCLALALPAQSQETPSKFPDAADLRAAIEAFDIPGVAMATIEGCVPGEVVTVGTADYATGAPVTERTAFEAASLTKPVFAWIVMSLVNEGAIDLDRPIAERFAYPRIPDAEGYVLLTPRMILTHRTGLPNWVNEGTDFHDRTAPIPFEAPPGTAFSYSGEAFQLLQAFVEQETEQTLQALFQNRLGDVMPNSALQRPLPGTVDPSRAYQSARAPGAGRGMDNVYNRAMAASSLATTAGDYARFLAHVCSGGGLRADLMAEMLRPQSPAPPEVIRIGDGPMPPPVSWGLGWMIIDLGDETLAGHGGSNDEYNAFGGFVQESGDGLVLMTNGANGERMIEALLLSGSER
ncbi:MAG: serine hydrolase domain-containing protein [Jannaschia sp.]